MADMIIQPSTDPRSTAMAIAWATKGGRMNRAAACGVGFLCGVVAMMLVGAAAQRSAGQWDGARWEYGQIRNAEGRISWLSDGQVIEIPGQPDAVAGLTALAKQIDPATSPQVLSTSPYLSTHNALGKLGWEFVREEHGSAGFSYTWFRRAKR